MDLEIGSVYEGKVTAITKYGAFIALPMGKTGMIHISEIANSYVNDIRNHLEEGQEVSVRVIGIDKEGKISLSIKKMKNGEDASFHNEAARRDNLPVSFEDKLKQFMAESESRMSDLKQHLEKRNGSRRRLR
jgi:S1 RNA binding domain protein